MAPRRTLAVFDFDGTLSRRDCVVPFLRRVVGTPRLGTALARRSPAIIPAAVRRDRDTMKALATAAALRGQPVGSVADLAVRFADDVMRDGLRDDTRQRLEQHRADGAIVVIVSASYEVYLQPIAERLGVDAVLGTRLVVREGRFTGELEGDNCRAAEKVRRLESWLITNDHDRSALQVEAYGDSSGDDALAAYADAAWWAGDRTLAPWPQR